MKPRDILLTRIDDYLRPPLEALGFRYARSKITFSRKKGIATQEIDFQLDRYNSENNCTFWTHWTTRAPAYTTWYEQHFGQCLGNGHLGGAAEWNVPGWSRAVTEHACLRNDERDEGVMQQLVDDVKRAGIPWIDSISTWKGAAEQLLKENWHFANAADFFLLAEDEASASATILKGIQLYTSGGRFDQSRELPELQLRLAKFFPGAELSKVDAVPSAQPATTTAGENDGAEDFLMAALETAGTAESAVVFEPHKLVRELNAYGEPEAANKITQLETKELLAIGRRAHAIWSTFSGEHGPMLDKAICLAIVEYIEGSPRELRRKRRQYPKNEA
jgi:hypothetical protein